LSYIDELAQAIRRRIPSRLVPEGDTEALFRLYAVLAMAVGEHAALEDVHNAWAAWMTERNPQHESLKPLHELSAEVQSLDQPYLDAIRAAARDRGIRR
jgi:hypothetical protein